jgi:transposase
MARIVDHLSVEDLGRRYRESGDVCSARHFQAIWLLAQGRTFGDVASTTGLARRWFEQLARRYNGYGPEALGDRRRGNGAPARILTPELLEKLRARLVDPPPDGGVWPTPKIAVWMAQELGVVSVFAQRAWDALRAIGWTIQKPRPKNPKSATPEEAAGFKKRLGGAVAEEQAKYPDTRDCQESCMRGHNDADGGRLWRSRETPWPPARVRRNVGRHQTRLAGRLPVDRHPSTD